MSHPRFILTFPEGQPTATTTLGTRGPIGRQPIQTYWDALTCRDRVIRLVGTCYGCSRPLYRHDDGDGAEPWSAGNSLDPADYGFTGPAIGLCLACANDSPRYAAALDSAQRRYWAAA